MITSDGVEEEWSSQDELNDPEDSSLYVVDLMQAHYCFGLFRVGLLLFLSLASPLFSCYLNSLFVSKWKYFIELKESSISFSLFSLSPCSFPLLVLCLHV